MNHGFNIVIDDRARKNLARLDPIVRKRIGKAIKRYAEHPLHYARKLTNPQIIGNYRWRVGNYRIIFDFVGTTINIIHIGHRRDIYEQ